MDAQTTRYSFNECQDIYDLAGYVRGESWLFYNTLKFWRKEGERKMQLL